MKPDTAIRRIASFEKRFGKPHLYLAYHAAFPLALTADLLYHLWINFQHDIHGRVLDIPWVAVADILLSPLCEEVGRELYEMDGEVRHELLQQLKADANFDQRRILQLSDFLLEYVQQQLYSDNPDIQDFAQAQQWTALAYKQPKDAARKLALAYAQLDHQDTAELVRLESVVETLAEPLRGFHELQIYACGMAHFARGELKQAIAQLTQISKTGNQINVAGVSLSIPEEIRKTQSWTIRRFLKMAGLTAVGLGGLGTAVLSPRVRQLLEPVPRPSVSGQSQDLPLEDFDFEVVTVDSGGQVTKRQRHQSQFFRQDLGSRVTLEMVAIPGGTFYMGAPKSEKGSMNNEFPQHHVTVKPFYMSKYPITQKQWRIVAALPKVIRSLDRNPSGFKGDKRPVESVSWYDAEEFCARLSQQTGIVYRLPSEAEWEYACRAGTTTPFYFGETITSTLANYRGTETYASEFKHIDRGQTTPVGQFRPNTFGLYDMHGNVWEWCADPWRDNYNDAPRIMRGGSWVLNPRYCRSAIHIKSEPDVRDDSIGFRVVCS